MSVLLWAAPGVLWWSLAAAFFWAAHKEPPAGFASAMGLTSVVPLCSGYALLGALIALTLRIRMRWRLALFAINVSGPLCLAGLYLAIR